MAIREILVLFKTHLDVGFTDFSEIVVESYFKKHIPNAISVGETLHSKNIDEGFVWTTGSWLIDKYLKTCDDSERARMINAINKGFIRWHGLPFTMHSEICDADLYRFGLSISKGLDSRFNVNTIAAKYTDVPGHTAAIVPLLYDAGIELLHIGVNPASTPPDVPNLFRWRFDGKEITVMYDKGDYGQFSIIPGTDTAVCFAHTGDNLGPQDPQQILDIYADLHSKYPEAKIKASSLNEVALAIRPIVETLPVITSEMGDTWIHGAGTDPGKVAAFRGLLRYAKTIPQEYRCDLYSSLLLIPEHTWGLDEKTHLHQNKNYSKHNFNAARLTPDFIKMEKSWQEQRGYLASAIESLPAEYQQEAYDIISETSMPLPDCSKMKAIKPGKPIKIDLWEIAISEQGSIEHLSFNDQVICDRQHQIGRFSYHAFSEDEVNAFGDRYLTHKYGWALEDFGKIGLCNEHKEAFDASVFCTDIRLENNKIYISISAEEKAFADYGCPKFMILILTFEADKMLMDFRWCEKPACRIPEALWLEVSPNASLKSIHKIGSVINPFDVVSQGNRELHAVSAGVEFENLILKTIDSPLISIGERYIYGFYNQIPDSLSGVFVNLFNNQWGTNFPMWYDNDARFRFEIIPT